jgi:hypothetical protein
MEEVINQTTVETEDTTPVEEVVQAEGSGDTAAVDTIPDDTAAEPSSTAQDLPPVPTVTVKYNHEERQYTAEEAATELQKRMHRDAQIEVLAAAMGIDPDKYCEKMLQQMEDNRRRELEAQLGDPKLVDTVMAAEKHSRKQAVEAAAAARKAAAEEAKRTESQRLADSFAELQGNFPDVKTVADVPDAVLKLASQKQITLLDAMLRINHQNSVAAAAAAQQAASAAENSTGEMGGADVGTSPEVEAMKRALWG